MLQIKNLTKSFGDVLALDRFSLDLEKGEVLGLLGPNGAGKTTTVEILEGYRSRSGGEVSVLGHDPTSNSPDLKRRIGIVLQATGVQP